MERDDKLCSLRLEQMAKFPPLLQKEKGAF